MTTTDRVQVRGDGLEILPPYTPDHRSRAYRWGKIVAVAAVVVFCVFYGMAFALFAPFLIFALIMPIPIALTFVIWALPDSRTAPTRLMAPLLFGLMFLLVMWPNYIAIAIPGLPWITMERLDGIPLAFVTLICLSTSQTFRVESARALRATPWLTGPFIAFLVLSTLSIFRSSRPFQSIDRYFVDQLGWTSVFFASVYVFLKPGRVEKMVVMLWGIGIAVGLIAVEEFRVEHVLWAGHIPSFLQIGDAAVLRILAGGSRFGIYRAVSTFGTPLGLGEYMALILPLVLHHAVGDYKLPVRIMGAASTAFVFVVAILSGARVGSLGCLIGATIYVAAWAMLKWRRDPQSLIGPAVLLAYPVLAAVMVGSTLFIGRLRNSFWGNGSQKFSDNARNDQWRLGIPKILHRPEGYGVGMGARTLGFHPFGMLTIDNYYLLIALEYGILGFILYYGMFVAAIAYSAKSGLVTTSKSNEYGFFIPLAISLTVFVIIKSSFSEQNNHPIVFMMLGMVVALVYRSVAEKAQPLTQTAPVVQRTPGARAMAPVTRQPVPGPRPSTPRG